MWVKGIHNFLYTRKHFRMFVKIEYELMIIVRVDLIKYVRMRTRRNGENN